MDNRGHFKPQYSAEQRAAIAQAKERDVSGSEVARLAARGALALGDEPIAAFTINRDTVNRIAREERQRAAQIAKSPVATLAESDPRAAARELVRRFVTLADAALGRLEHRPHNRPASPAELERVAPLVERVERITRHLEAKQASGKQATSSPADAAPDEPPGLLDRLAAAAEPTTPPSAVTPASEASTIALRPGRGAGGVERDADRPSDEHERGGAGRDALASDSHA